MRTVITASAAIAAILSGTPVSAAGTLRYCPSNSPSSAVCYSVGIPSSSAASGSGNIYFQLSAPTTFQWVALGTGTSMASSYMYIMYQDGAGNVTVSPRKGTFHTPPTLDDSGDAARLTLLEGSGVVDGVMRANVRCENCEKWDGGELGLASTASSWVAAWKGGESMATGDKGARISQHDDTAGFQLDLTKAAIATDANPFVDAAVAPGGGSGSGTGGAGGDGAAGAGDGGAGAGDGVIAAKRPSASILAAHGAIMAVVFVILYPLGALLMPLLGKWWAHAGFQAMSWALMWIAFGLGVKAAKERAMLFKQSHTILGTVVVCLLVIQPALGYAHHRYFVANQRRGIVSHVHIWWGRILMALGVINGGLGLRLANASNSLKIAYGVVAGILFLLYAAGKTLVSLRRKHAGGPARSRKEESGSPVSQPYAA